MARLAHAALVLLYAVAAIFFLTRGGEHAELLILTAEFLVLAPALWIALRHPRSFPAAWRFPVPPLFGILLGGFLLTNAAGFLVTGHTPLYGDETSYAFQARIFDSARWAAAAPEAALRPFFYFHHTVIAGENWLSKYPPLWPALLAIAVPLHAEWLLNPLLGVAYLYLAWRIGVLLYDDVTSRVAVLLLAASPSFWHYSAGLMSHALCAVVLVGSFYFFLRARDGWRLKEWILCVALLSAAALDRPYTAFCFGLLIAGAVAMDLRGSPPRLFVLAAAALPFIAAATALLGLYNVRLMGQLNSYFSQGQLLSLNPALIWQLQREGLRWSLQGILFYLVPLLAVPVAVAVARPGEGANRRSTWLLAGLVMILIAAHCCFLDLSGTGMGERYYYEGYFALTLLAARGLLSIGGGRYRFSPAFLVPILFAWLMHAGWYGLLGHRRAEKPRAVIAAARSITQPSGIVYLPYPVGRNVNLNDADWRRAPLIYLEDPGPGRRGEIASRLGRSAVFVVAYDEVSKTARVEPEIRGKL